MTEDQMRAIYVLTHIGETARGWEYELRADEERLYYGQRGWLRRCLALLWPRWFGKECADLDNIVNKRKRRRKLVELAYGWLEGVSSGYGYKPKNIRILEPLMEILEKKEGFIRDELERLNFLLGIYGPRQPMTGGGRVGKYVESAQGRLDELIDAKCWLLGQFHEEESGEVKAEAAYNNKEVR